MEFQANMVPSILWLSVIISVIGTGEAGKYALGQAGNLNNCPAGFTQIRDYNECKLSAEEAGKKFEMERCFANPDMDKVCFEPNNGHVYFSICNYVNPRKPTNPKWSAFCKDPNALAPGQCNTASDCSADLPTCHAEGFCHDPTKCKFVPLKPTECPGYEANLQKCHADMSNGEFCNAAELKPLPDGSVNWDVNSCEFTFDTFKCVRGEFEVTEGACRTKNGEDDDFMPCDARIRNLWECKRKCNERAGCGAVSWNGNTCCGLSEKTTTSDETAWKCYAKSY